MKILRIQGKNLASIAGEFDIDFTAAPLRSAGIFAICGPTGAGKSTILDESVWPYSTICPAPPVLKVLKCRMSDKNSFNREIVVKYSAEVLPKRWLL